MCQGRCRRRDGHLGGRDASRGGEGSRIEHRGAEEGRAQPQPLARRSTNDSTPRESRFGAYCRLNLYQPIPGGTYDGIVFLLPIPAGHLVSRRPYVFRGHLDITVPSGTPIVVPIAFAAGERYPDGRVQTPPPDEWWGTRILWHVTLDGAPVLQDAPHFIPAAYFDPPVECPETAPWGATAGLWFQGVGFVTTPLEPGVHTRTSNVIFDNSWTITVVPRGQYDATAHAAALSPATKDGEETRIPVLRASEIE
jgi:hypothetical protein